MKTNIYISLFRYDQKVELLIKAMLSLPEHISYKRLKIHIMDTLSYLYSHITIINCDIIVIGKVFLFFLE